MTTARDMMRPCPEVREGTTVAELVRLMAEQPALVTGGGKLLGAIQRVDLVQKVLG